VIWSVNYPRHLRARVTGRIMVNGAIALAVAGLLLGWLLEQQGPWYRLAILAAAAAGVLGSLQFRSLRVRQERRLLEDERERLRDGARFDLSGVRQLLAGDARFRRYMLAMSVFGAGHLMLTPLLVVCIDDVLGAPEIVQVAVTAALPVLVMPVAIQPWARFLDRHHVIVFRSVHAWIAVAGALMMVAAVLASRPALLWPGSLLMGVSLAAGSLGWSLGHNDFAPRGEETRYMALHVTLTGLRGLLAPPAAILAYHGLKRLYPGVEPWTLLLPVTLIALGAWLFTSMRRTWREVPGPA
jgi:Na+/melibiose symporter-like transporter